MKRGVPPTAAKARTGELTPPGVTARARSKSAREAGTGLVTGSLSPRPLRVLACPRAAPVALLPER